MQNLKVLGVKIDNITFKDACETAIKSITQNKKLHIATVNPEITLKAHKDNKYKNILNKTQLNTADGIGILWATHYIQKTKNKNKFLKIVLWFETLAKIFFTPNSIKTPIKERVSGSDLMLEICKNAPSKKINIFLLGAKPHVAKKTKIELFLLNRGNVVEKF